MCFEEHWRGFYFFISFYTISMVNFYLFEVKWIFVFLWGVFEYLFHWNNKYTCCFMQSIVYFFYCYNTEDARWCRNANFFSKILMKNSILKDTFELMLVFQFRYIVLYNLVTVRSCITSVIINLNILRR